MAASWQATIYGEQVRQTKLETRQRIKALVVHLSRSDSTTQVAPISMAGWAGDLTAFGFMGPTLTLPRLGATKSRPVSPLSAIEPRKPAITA